MIYKMISPTVLSQNSLEVYLACQKLFAKKRRKEMPTWQYTKGLHDLGNSIYAYLQPNGSWGWSNAGLITDGEVALLIDTLFDLKLTDSRRWLHWQHCDTMGGKLEVQMLFKAWNRCWSLCYS